MESAKHTLFPRHSNKSLALSSTLFRVVLLYKASKTIYTFWSDIGRYLIARQKFKQACVESMPKTIFLVEGTK